MTSAIYFGAFTDVKFINIGDLKDIRHFILVDQLPERVKYFKPGQYGYTTCFNETVFISELYHQLRIQNVKIIDMIQRLDFVKFIVMRDDNQITVDYYYNTTVEDAITVSELGDVMKHVDTLIMCGFTPFKCASNLTYEYLPSIQNVWISYDSEDFENYESTSKYMSIQDFKNIDYDGDLISHWGYPSSSSDDESDNDSNTD